MEYAVVLYLDKETEGKIMSLIQKVADYKLSTKFLEYKVRPHVTLAMFHDVDENKCVELLENFVREKKTLPAYLDSVGMFNDTKAVFINPTMTRNMYQLQSDLHEVLKEFDTRGFEWYLPDGWVPHCSVVMSGEDEDEVFYKSSELILREFRKMEGTYAEIGLIKVTMPVEEIATIPFDVE